MPRPLHGPLHAIGVALQDAGRAIVHAVNSLGRITPGGSVVVWLVLAALFTWVCVLFANRYSRGVMLQASERGGGTDATTSERAPDLERAADRAEREGRLADAVRLRFRAGLARLAEREVIRTASSIPSAEVARALHSDQFDALAGRFDEIAYGGAAAGADDVESARAAWPAILRGVRSK